MANPINILIVEQSKLHNETEQLYKLYSSHFRTKTPTCWCCRQPSLSPTRASACHGPWSLSCLWRGRAWEVVEGKVGRALSHPGASPQRKSGLAVVMLYSFFHLESVWPYFHNILTTLPSFFQAPNRISLGKTEVTFSGLWSMAVLY